MYLQFIKMLKDIRDQDFNKTPKIIFMGRFRKALIDRGFSVAVAEKLSTMMKLDISADALNDEQLTESVNVFADVVVKIKDAYVTQGYVDVDGALVSSASELSFSI